MMTHPLSGNSASWIHYFFLWFLLVLFVGMPVRSQNADINLLKKINLNRNRNLDPAFLSITHSVTPISIAVPVSVLATGLITKDKSLRNKGYEMVVAVGSTVAITYALKYGVHRERPYVTYPGLNNPIMAADPSFPSGHTSSAFATATTLSLNFPKWYVIVPAYVWAGGAAYSRLHLGVHYPSDVLAGAVIGAGSAYLTHKANQWLQHKKKRKIIL